MGYCEEPPASAEAAAEAASQSRERSVAGSVAGRGNPDMHDETAAACGLAVTATGMRKGCQCKRHEANQRLLRRLDKARSLS